MRRGEGEREGEYKVKLGLYFEEKKERIKRNWGCNVRGRGRRRKRG